MIWYGWSPSRPLQDMAFSMEGNVYIAAYTIWAHESDDAAMQDWVTSHFRGLETVSKGSYLGDADLTRRSSKFMADANFAKLGELRRSTTPIACSSTSTSVLDVRRTSSSALTVLS